MAEAKVNIILFYHILYNVYVYIFAQTSPIIETLHVYKNGDRWMELIPTLSNDVNDHAQYCWGPPDVKSMQSCKMIVM